MTDIPYISQRHCDCCGTPLPDGTLFYHCRTELVAAKDSTLHDLKHPDKLIAQALSEIAGKDESDLLEEIYQEIILQLCPDCRTTLLRHIHSMLNKGCHNCPKHGSTPPQKMGKILKFPTNKDSRKKT